MPLETIYRQKPFHSLTDTQKQEKLQKDSEYEIAVQNLYASLPKDKAITEKQKLWDKYLQWAKANDLYEQVTPEQQLSEAESGLNETVTRVNEIRVELNKPVLELKEKAKMVM